MLMMNWPTCTQLFTLSGFRTLSFLLFLPNRYSQSSFTVTNIEGASASFTFNGTGVEIYGAKRFNHGLFQVKLDNTPYPPSSGYAPDTGVFQEPIFSVGGLAPGLHTVTLINQEKKFLDIDFVGVSIFSIPYRYLPSFYHKR